MARITVIAAVCLALLSCLVPLSATDQAHAAPNPFIHGKDEARREVAREAPAAAPGVLSPVLGAIARWQLAIRSQMASFAGDIKENPSGFAFWLFMALSFAYGALHALGPGHGKVFAVSYFLNRPGPLSLGFAFGNLSMVFHVLSSAVIVLAGKYVLEASMSVTVERLGARLELASYGLLTVIGLVLLGKVLLEWKRGGHDHGPRKGPGSVKELLAMTMAAGLVPCPGAALVLIFSITLGIQWAGLLALVFISLGMGLTISAFSMTAILSRGLVLKALDRHERLYQAAHLGISLAGGLAITLAGAVLLAGRLYSA